MTEPQKVIEYTLSSSYSDCEQCGGNYAEGIVLTLDGQKIVDEEVTGAACWGNPDWNLEKALIRLLEHLGYRIYERQEDSDPVRISVDENANLQTIYEEAND